MCSTQLRFLAPPGKTLDAEVLRVALEAETPQLKAFALRHISGRAPQDLLPVVLAALDNPYAMVREAAMQVLHNTDVRYDRYSDRHATRPQVRFPVADVAPDADALGGSLYPGATFRPFADPLDRVIAFYAKGNRKALTTAEVTAEQKKKIGAMSNPMEMIERMKKARAEGKDPAAAIMEMQKEMAGVAPIPWSSRKARGWSPRATWR